MTLAPFVYLAAFALAVIMAAVIVDYLEGKQ
jgi:hypothetical protein